MSSYFPASSHSTGMRRPRPPQISHRGPASGPPGGAAGPAPAWATGCGRWCSSGWKGRARLPSAGGLKVRFAALRAPLNPPRDGRLAGRRVTIPIDHLANRHAAPQADDRDKEASDQRSDTLDVCGHVGEAGGKRSRSEVKIRGVGQGPSSRESTRAGLESLSGPPAPLGQPTRWWPPNDFDVASPTRRAGQREPVNPVRLLSAGGLKATAHREKHRQLPTAVSSVDGVTT